MIKIKRKICFIVSFLFFLVLILNLTNLALAAGYESTAGSSIGDVLLDKDNELSKVGAIGYTYGSDEAMLYPSEIIAKLLRSLFLVLGSIFLGLTVYGGFRWMMAGGRDEEITTARSIITNAAIGLGIIIFSYTITYYVLKNLIIVTVTDEARQNNDSKPSWEWQGATVDDYNTP